MKREIIGKILNYIDHSWQYTYPGIARRDQLTPVGQVFTTPNFLGTGLNQLFYWDTYYTNLGLIQTGRVNQAKANTDALIQLLNVTGFVPNINNPDGNNRSQTPHLMRMVRDIYEATKDKEYLVRREPYLRNEYLFWNTERNTASGLARYGHNGTDEYLADFYGLLVKRLNFNEKISRKEKIRISSHYLAEAESCCDFTSRFMGHCGDFAAVDLNAHLAYYERSFLWVANELGRTDEGFFWENRFQKRRDLIHKYLWNEKRGYFFDYDEKNNAQSPVYTAAAFSYLWNRIASREQAERMVGNLDKIEFSHGVTATDDRYMEYEFQWDYPYGWPSHQYMVVQGLLEYGYEKEALRIAENFLNLMVSLYEETGNLWEKYDVVNGRIGNVEYGTETQLGWTAGVFIAFVKLLGVKRGRSEERPRRLTMISMADRIHQS